MEYNEYSFIKSNIELNEIVNIFLNEISDTSK